MRRCLSIIAVILATVLAGLNASGMASPSPGDIALFAGGGGADGGSPLEASIATPAGIAYDSAGDIYVADAGGCRIRKVSAGTIVTVAGNGDCMFAGDGNIATAASLNLPRGIAFDGQDVLYIADTANCRVRRLQDGLLTTVAGSGACTAADLGDNQLAAQAAVAPADVAIAANGDLFIADAQNCRIRKVAAGLITTVVGTGTCGYSGDGGAATQAQLKYPTSIAVHPDGSLIISDAWNCRIRRVAGGVIETLFYDPPPRSTVCPGPISPDSILWSGGLRDITISSNGDLLIADYCRLARLSGGVFSEITPLLPPWMACSSTPVGSGQASATNLGTVPSIAVKGSTIAFGQMCLVAEIVNDTISTAAGNGECWFSGDGGPATNAAIGIPMSIAADGDGNLYEVDLSCRVRRISAGIIQTIVGTGGCNALYSGEGGPASKAAISRSEGIAASPNGDLYIVDKVYCAVRKVDSSTGLISTVAGQVVNYGCGFSGDGGPATDALMYWPIGIAVSPNGTLYIADSWNCRVRMVEAGIITTFAGAGCQKAAGDGGPAVDAYLEEPRDIAIDPSGNVYILDRCRVRRVTNGIIDTVAGGEYCSYGGDRLPATSVSLAGPTSIALDEQGNLYIAESSEQNDCRIQVVHNSIIYTIAGTSRIPGLTACGFNGEGIPARLAQVNQPQSIEIANGDLFIADSVNFRIRVIRGVDGDGDGVPLGADTCPGIADPAQLNTDANPVDNTPPATQDDYTRPNSDLKGDPCDDDDDNDGLTDIDEATGSACMGGYPTNPVLSDTDGDRMLDGAECSIGTDPLNASSKPTPAQCGLAIDSDHDRLSDRVEYCGYNTSPDNEDTDGDGFVDGGSDGCEAASINGDRTVNSADQLMLLLEILREPVPSARLADFDINKDGSVNAGDQLMIAGFIAGSGSCPR